MKVNVIGLGYIGLPTASLIASKGINVLGVDINTDVVRTVNDGNVHISEPDLDGLVHKVVKEGFLKASTKPEHGDVFIIAVPTPFRENYEPDISFVKSAINMIIPFLRNGNLVIIESTVPVGITQKMFEFIKSKKPNIKVYMAYCPERVLPGKILFELENNSRIVGGINKESSQKAKEFYSIFVKAPIYETTTEVAEMCKLVENAYRDVNIAFANEISIICDKANINPWEVINLANKHPRVNILNPGVGVGGHCIAVDPWFLISKFPAEAKLMKTAREVNTNKTKLVIKKIKQKAINFRKTHKRYPKIACLGLTYKPDIDDLRESPALYIVQTLLKEGFDVLPVEPNLNTSSLKELRIYNFEEAFQEADIISILVCHTFFRKKLSLFDKYGKENKEILDFCGLTNLEG